MDHSFVFLLHSPISTDDDDDDDKKKMSEFIERERERGNGPYITFVVLFSSSRLTFFFVFSDDDGIKLE